MEKRNSDFGYISGRVPDLPPDYARVKEEIISDIRPGAEEVRQPDWENAVYAYLNTLPFENGWKRRHVYLLIHDLLNQASLFEGSGQMLLDAETGITGDCSPESMVAFPGEPQNKEALVEYIRSFEWL